MTFLTVLDFINVFFAGMLAGMEFVIHYGVRTPAEQLPDHAQLQLRQALVPAFFVPAAVLGIALAVLESAAPGLVLRWVGVVALLTWAMIRVVGTVPINSATLAWQLSAPPTNWKAQVSRAERFHIIGVWAAILAFACFLTAVALQVVVH